jgi:hypothetical protein
MFAFEQIQTTWYLLSWVNQDHGVFEHISRIFSGLSRVIDILNDGVTYPNYFTGLFDAQSDRYQKVLDTNGALLSN